MAIEQILAPLIAERGKLNQAFEALEWPIHRRGPKNSPANRAYARSNNKRRTLAFA
jgi:hypothetical protein